MAEPNLDRFFDAALWEELRGIILPVVDRRFREAFLVGAQMGAMQRPARERETDQAGDPMLLGERASDQPGPNIQPGDLTVLPFDIEAIESATERVVSSYSDAWWQQFTRGTQEQMRRIIIRAERLGLTVEDVIREMTPLFGPVRAQRIAVSELTNLLGMGAQETYRLAGFGRWQWRTVRDSAVDPICKGRDRKTYPISTPFRRAHVNCRCWPVPYGRPTAERIAAA